MSDIKPTTTLEEITSLSKRRGFVYQTSEIYGGLANSYEYGPAGVEVLRKIKNLWWDFFISKREDMLGLDSQIILHPKTWEASGHVNSFADPMVEDKITHKRYRADHLIEEWLEKNKIANPPVVEAMKLEDMANFLKENKVKSPDSNEISEVKNFNLLFETSIGVIADESNKVYLRGETAQGIFSNFKQILDSNRVKLPFGVGQIGKSFRNEITTGQFVFRTLEFEQAEIEYFFDPETSNWEALFKDWQDKMWYFATEILGIDASRLRWRRHDDAERSFYSKDTYDLEYLYPFGWKEVWGIAYRTDYDLKQHMKFSAKSLEYTDPFTMKKFVPHVIEPAVGVNRLFLMVLCDAYQKDETKNRLVLKLDQKLAPYQLAVFPLLKNKEELVKKAREIFEQLGKKYRVSWDERGNIGKRYLSQDELGTPYCLTIDFETLEDDSITVRQRDNASQERIKLKDLEKYLTDMLA
ncbi:MAG: Glycine-tRNA ligase [Candidatus Pacebacteria bacterium GW2011_GWF2_38_9]|nr:MAG: glycyl-tRNA synthetase, glycyl-tRNA synthetase [candidate division TM6 bacterium GW2011_GWF2_28_16]KKQ88886.1 MAG: Glycine-tRNA ligase [Candidatus Pacebacteria bacterium GW2011_GWF2_38_9]HAZ73417.1 glycine--tRNA ligase [Candidatus Paceibacterota bacterium]